ncbi:MAG: trigger factor, partial [Muribaculaceae bacterium]|nr:trigger factor [Muribaculaceae bacterium]
ENAFGCHFTFKNQELIEKFVGSKPGDHVTFNPYTATEGNVAELASLLNIDREAAAEAKGDFVMTINEITGIKPAEHNEEFFKQAFGADCTDEEKYKEAIRKMIASQLLPNSAALFERMTRETLLEKCGNFELPAEFLKKWFVRRNEGLTAETVDAEYEKAIPSIKWELISGQIARQLDVKVTEDDLLNYATHMAARQFAQYGMTNIDEDMLKGYAKNMLQEKDSRRYIIDAVTNANLFEAIGHAVTIDDNTVSLDEFKTLAEKYQ